MNKLLLTALSLAACVSAFGQGQFNASNNFEKSPGVKAFVLDLAGLPLSKANGRVEIVTLDGTSLLTGGAAGKTLLLDGLFSQSNVPIPGFPVGSINVPLIVRAWDSTSGATYADALVRGSAAITVGNAAAGLGGGTTPNATLALNSTFTGFQLSVVPEPATIALGAFGLVGLFFVARRKS